MSAETREGRDRPLIAWLGDDFTGAAAVMEVLSFAGLRSILYLSPPEPELLAESEGCAGIGIATLARAKEPEWMTENLPSIYEALNSTKADLIHYKICSTLDSSPTIGSIGKAIEIGLECFGSAAVPVVTAAPKMRRYQAFGNLFSSTADGVFRLDRHPVMARHPITPMDEADVAKHLARQTSIPTGCITLEDLASGTAADKIASEAQIWTIDLISEDQEKDVGKLLWDRRGESRFVVGSQGIEYALVAHLQNQGVAEENALPPGLGRDDRIAVVSGSVSPTSAAQIAWARDNGFAAIRLDVSELFSGNIASVEAQTFAAARTALMAGKPPIIFTAEGPEDSGLNDLETASEDASLANDAIGRALGRILKLLIEELDLKRVAVSGGDTSGRVCETLGIYALEAAAPTVPGAPICRARAKGQMDGLEIALKGGQMGTAEFFGWVRDGGGTPAPTGKN